MWFRSFAIGFVALAVALLVCLPSARQTPAFLTVFDSERGNCVRRGLRKCDHLRHRSGYFGTFHRRRLSRPSTTLRLHFIEGYTLDEVAKMLGQTKGNVRHHSFRGLERLRKQIFDSKLPGARAV
jgi:hypothetical protein